MNRRNFFQTIVAIIAVFFTKAKAKVKRTTPIRSTMGAVWVPFSFTTTIGKPGNMICPFCGDIIAEIEEGGLYPTTLYCRKCKIGFNKCQAVRNCGYSKIAVEYIYEP